MKVSVVIPTYNEEKYIGWTLNSLMNQTVKPYEIVVVDNNCTDRTVEIAKEYEGVKIVKECEQGFIPARNRAFDSAKGDIIFRLDSDSRVESDCIERIIKNFDNTDIVGLTGRVSIHDFPILRFINFWEFQTWLAKVILKLTVFFGFATIMRREAWESIRDDLSKNTKYIQEDLEVSIVLNNLGRVYCDREMTVFTSGRGLIKNFKKHFIEYQIKNFKTLWCYRKELPRFREIREDIKDLFSVLSNS